jgi:hypothetical protein
MKNADKAFRVLEFMEQNPDRVDMETFGRDTECGTVGCFAGWYMMFDGFQLDYADYLDDVHYIIFVRGEERVSVDEYVKSDLGLDEYDANMIFYNTPFELLRQELERLADE